MNTSHVTRHTGKRWLAGKVLLLVLVAFAGVGCESLPQRQAVPTFIPPAVVAPSAIPGSADTGQPAGSGRGSNVVRATRGPITQAVRGRGRMGSIREATLYFPLQGVVNKILVASGDQVAQGTTILELDTFQLAQDVTNAQFSLDKANLDLKQTQARVTASDFKIEIASNVYSRTLQTRSQAWADYQAIAPVGPTDATVKARYDRFQQADRDFLQASIDLNYAKIEKQSAALAVDAAQLAIQQGQKLVEQAQTRLTGAKVSAPFAGLVISIDKNVGDLVQAFEPVGAIADPSQLQIEASIPENDAAGIGLGQAAVVVLDGFPDRKFTGKVKEISAKPSIFQGKSVYRIVIAFDKPAEVPPSIRVGADISLIQQVKNNVLVVPSSAVTSDGTRRYITVIRDGKPQRIEVQVGIVSDTQSEILSGVLDNEQIQVP